MLQTSLGLQMQFHCPDRLATLLLVRPLASLVAIAGGEFAGAARGGVAASRRCYMRLATACDASCVATTGMHHHDATNLLASSVASDR